MWKTAEHFKVGPVTFLEHFFKDMIEIAHGLMIVDTEQKLDLVHGVLWSRRGRRVWAKVEVVWSGAVRKATGFSIQRMFCAETSRPVSSRPSPPGGDWISSSFWVYRLKYRFSFCMRSS